MIREELIYKIQQLLNNSLISPDERLRFAPLLPKMSDEDLKNLYQTLVDRIEALVSTENLFYQIRKSGEDTLDISKIISDDAKFHPLFDLTLEDAFVALREHLIEFVQRGIDLRKEYDLYLESQRNILLDDGGATMEAYDPKQVRDTFMRAIRECRQVLPDDASQIRVGDLVKRYDVIYPSTETQRGGFERTSFVDSSKVSGLGHNLLLEILSLYDHLVYSGSVILMGLDISKLLSGEEMPTDRPSMELGPAQTEYKKQSISGPIFAPVAPSIVSQPPAAKPLANPPLPNITAAPSLSKMQTVPPAQPPRPTPVVVDKIDVPSTPSLLLEADVTKQKEEWKKQNIGGSKIFDLFFNAIQQKDQKIILAGLNALAESGELLHILKTDSRFYYLLANYYRHQKRLNDLKEFHMSFADPRYVKELIRYILAEQLKLSEDEAAHIGVDIINLLRQKEVNIKHWAYYDVASQKYKWL